MNLYSWLFEKARVCALPQLAYGAANKQALLWLPGNSWAGQAEVTRRIKAAVFRGATQLAFDHYTVSQAIQGCEVCWIGLDLDEGPLDMSVLTEAAARFNLSIRSSASGKGRHMIGRLDNTIVCGLGVNAGRVVTSLTSPIVSWLNQHGQPVCKADKRVFWLEGGRNEWLFKTDSLVAVPAATVAGLTQLDEQNVQEAVAGSGPGLVSLDDLLPGVRQWVRQFQAAGCLPNSLKRNMPLNVTRLVRLLRSNGEAVETQAGLTTTTGVNGYMDLTPNSISLWAFADGHSIWRWVDA